MKLLRNPYLVGALVMVALVMLSRNLIVAQWQRFFSPKAPAAAAASPAPKQASPPSSGAPAPSSPVEPAVPIDQSQVGWVKSPRRNPFQSANPSGASGETFSASGVLARAVLRLAAIWLQDNRRLAVINGLVVGEGEAILGFKIEAIETDLVRLRGPGGGSARLEFPTAAPPVPKDSAANTNAPGRPGLSPHPDPATGKHP